MSDLREMRDRSPHSSKSDDRRERWGTYRKNGGKSVSPVFHKKMRKQEKVVHPELTAKEKKERIDGDREYKVPAGLYPYFAIVNQKTGDNCIRFMQGRCRSDCFCNSCRETTDQRRKRMCLDSGEPGEGKRVLALAEKFCVEELGGEAQRSVSNFVPLGPRTTAKSPETLEDFTPRPLKNGCRDQFVTDLSSDESDIEEIRTIHRIADPEEPGEQEDHEYHVPDPVSDTLRDVFALVRVTETKEGEISKVSRVPTDFWFQQIAAKAVNYQLLRNEELAQSLDSLLVDQTARKEIPAPQLSPKSFMDFLQNS